MTGYTKSIVNRISGATFHITAAVVELSAAALSTTLGVDAAMGRALHEAAASLAEEKLRLQRRCGPKNQDDEDRAQAKKHE